MAWLALSIDVKDEAVDWVCTLLAANGYDGAARVGEVPAAERDERWRHRVAFHLPDDPGGRARARKLAEALDGVTRTGMAGELQSETVPEKPPPAEARPRPIGRRFVLFPPGTPTPPDDPTQGGRLAEPEPPSRLSSRPAESEPPIRLPIRLAAGLAFGSGLHPATVVALRLIERHTRRGQPALDLGSGSGILSVALARLGARVLALDNDPVAVDATRATVRLNGLDAEIEVARGSLGRGARFGHWLGWTELPDAPVVEADGRFDLVVANVLARLHAELAPDYRRALAHGGRLITSGYTRDVEADVARALSEAGLSPADRAQLGDYVALAHTL